MTKVIGMEAFKRQQAAKNAKQNQAGNNLTELLKAATILRQGVEEIKTNIVVMDFDRFKQRLEARMADITLTRKEIGVDFFLCSNYVAALLAEIGSSSPESWFAVDYFLKNADGNDPVALRQGANVCFLICTVFPERSRIRCMKYADYEAMGIGLFFNYYNQTGKVIAYHMSKRFKPMAEITKECLGKL